MRFFKIEIDDQVFNFTNMPISRWALKIVVGAREQGTGREF
jgi:hypothetical protein